MEKKGNCCDEKSLQAQGFDDILNNMQTKEGGIRVKKFFGGMFIEEELLRKEGIYHPIKLEYYKIINDNKYKENKFRYGLEVIKTEYFPRDVKVEKNEIIELTNDENLIKKMLRILKENKVTPVEVEDVIQEIFTKPLQIAEN